MFPKWYHGLIYFVALSINPIRSTQVFYTLASKGEDVKVEDENVPFLSRSFFLCVSNEDCSEVARRKGKSQFKEVIGKENIGEDSIVYEKVKTLQEQGNKNSKQKIS